MSASTALLRFRTAMAWLRFLWVKALISMTAPYAKRPLELSKITLAERPPLGHYLFNLFLTKVLI